MRNVLLRSPGRPAVLAVLLGLAWTPAPRGDELARPVTGEARLAGGRVAGYTVHYDRNSLRDSRRSGDRLVARTSAGSLLTFELPAVKFVRERLDSEEITCLGRGEGEAVLAGLADGRVCRVDPRTLELTDVVKLPSAPRWIGWDQARPKRAAGLIALTERTRTVEEDGQRWDAPVSVVHDLAARTTTKLDQKATTVLLDRAGRLWLGADKGEWGGWVARVDLQGGGVAELKPPHVRESPVGDSWDGIYGFVELRDGQVWAFGGTSHMGFNTGVIVRVDGPRPRPLFSTEPSGKPGAKPDPDRPQLPITHVVEEPGGLRVLSYSDVFRTDTGLTSWKKTATLKVHYRWGRPDAVGAYPSVRAVHPPAREGEPYVLATVGDGYVTLNGDRVAPHAVPGQLGAASMDRIENTAEGTFFFDYDDRLPYWRLGATGWEVASLAPPVEPDPGSDVAAFEKESGAWYETRVLVGPGGSITTVSGTGVSPGTRTTARRVNGRSERLGRETSDMDPSSSFVTADGTLWNAFYHKIRRFEAGRWVTVARQPLENGPSGRMTPLNAGGPPWWLHDRLAKNLWRLDHGNGGENARLTAVALEEGGEPLHIDDAIPWTDGTVLLATSVGLRFYSPATKRYARAGLPEPPRPATTLVRDGRGRLWLGGKGLWMVEPGAQVLESYDRVPWVGRSEVDALAPDPRHADGVIAALGSRGVAFVRAGDRP